MKAIRQNAGTDQSIFLHVHPTFHHERYNQQHLLIKDSNLTYQHHWWRNAEQKESRKSGITHNK